MFEIGLSTCGKKELNPEFIKQCRENGITALELSCSNDMIFDFDYPSFIETARKSDITIWSFHLPFLPFESVDVSSPDESVRESTVSLCKKIIEKFANLGIKRFILHPSNEPIEDAIRPEKMASAKKSVAELADFAEKYDALILIENLPRTCLGNCSKEIAELISVRPRLGVCFDTNHLLFEDIADFIKNTGDKIKSVHISDFDFINERHWLPGEGKIDWQSLLSVLKNAGYSGPWLYEVDFQIPNNIIRPRELTCDDFAKNALEIFNKKPITVISKPKENLGFWS